MAYDCSTQGSDGCGERFASLELFDAHLLRHADKERDPDCRSKRWLRSQGYRQTSLGVWFDPSGRGLHKADSDTRHGPVADVQRRRG